MDLPAWITQYDGVKQRSPEWYELRKSVIGGSTVATIAGLNPYSTMAKLAREKLGLIENDSPKTALQWGVLFEPMAQQIAEATYSCEILGTEIFVPGSGEFDGVAYSPDGLAIIDGDCVLFEFKCPFSRKPAAKPPAQYVAQVNMGLELCDIAARGILVEVLIKPGLAGAKYGWIEFVKTSDAEFICELPRKLESVDDIATMLQLVDEGHYTPKYSAVHTSLSSALPPSVSEGPLLVWSVIAERYHDIAKKEGFLAPLMPKIHEFMLRCSEATTLAQKLAVVAHYEGDVFEDS